MKRVFIIGEGRACKSLLDSLVCIPSASIVGMAMSPSARSVMKMAVEGGIPVWCTDPIRILEQLDVDIVFHLTDDSTLHNLLMALSKKKRFELVPRNVVMFFLKALAASDNDTLFKEHLKISLMIAQSKTLDQVFNAIVQGGMEITRMPMGSLAMFNKEEKTFTLLAHKGLPHTLTTSDFYPLRFGGLTQHLLAIAKPLILPDMQKNAPFESTGLLKSGIRSLIAVPLLSERSLLGILYFDDIRPRTFPAALMGVLRQFSTEAIIAIQKHQAITQVWHLSTRDPLTNLYNRNQFALQLREATFDAEQNNTMLGLLLCDLDRFREINETRGHHYGDKVLKLTAQRIKTALEKDLEQKTPQEVLLYRSGSDEIAVILSGTTLEEVSRKAGLIRKAIHEARSKINFPLDISIGMALYPQHSQSSDQLVVVAHQALQIAKKEETRICTGAVTTRYPPHRVGMIFEPIVDLDQERIIGYEALGRDVDREMNIMELFKKYDEQGRLSELKNACFLAQLKKASELGLSKIFLNVDSAILNQCEWVLKPPEVSVVLEISEAESLHDIEAYLKLAKRWKKKGFQFAIDDFGAGFISLPFLSRLNPDYIKLDRSVILQSVASRSFRSFLRNLVAVMQNAETPKIIAEGVETNAELKIVTAADIHFIQGFLLKSRGYESDLTKDLHKG